MNWGERRRLLLVAGEWGGEGGQQTCSAAVRSTHSRRAPVGLRTTVSGCTHSVGVVTRSMTPRASRPSSSSFVCSLMAKGYRARARHLQWDGIWLEDDFHRLTFHGAERRRFVVEDVLKLIKECYALASSGISGKWGNDVAWGVATRYASGRSRRRRRRRNQLPPT